MEIASQLFDIIAKETDDGAYEKELVRPDVLHGGNLVFEYGAPTILKEKITLLLTALAILCLVPIVSRDSELLDAFGGHVAR